MKQELYNTEPHTFYTSKPNTQKGFNRSWKKISISNIKKNDNSKAVLYIKMIGCTISNIHVLEMEQKWARVGQSEILACPLFLCLAGN